MEALLVRLPLALGEMFAVTVYTILAPFGRLTMSLKLPLLFKTGSHPFAPPFWEEQAHVQLLTWDEGILSAMTAPITALGPLFTTVTV